MLLLLHKATVICYRAISTAAIADPTLQSKPAAAGELYIPEES